MDEVSGGKREEEGLDYKVRDLLFYYILTGYSLGGNIK